MDTSTPIETLIHECKRQNRKAQRELYQRYAEAMFHLCLRLMPSQADAEDALQEAFVKAFRKIGQFSFEAAFGAWLKRIVVNQCMDQLRKDQKRIWLHKDEELPEGEYEDPAQALPEGLSVDIVRKAIKALPDGFRTVLTLYLLEGYDHQEIGEVLGISPSTSKSQYSRAKAKLRGLLGEYAGVA